MKKKRQLHCSICCERLFLDDTCKMYAKFRDESGEATHELLTTMCTKCRDEEILRLVTHGSKLQERIKIAGDYNEE